MELSDFANKMSQSVQSLSEYLETFEDTKFTKKSYTTEFLGLNVVFQQKDCIVTPKEVMRVLAIIEKCLDEDIMNIPSALTAVFSLLSNEKIMTNMSVEDLLPSALAILQRISTFKESDRLKCLAMQDFLAYPTNVLAAVINQNCADVINIFKVLKTQDYAIRALQGIDISPYFLLKGLLTKLPSKEKKQFVVEGLTVWFTDLLTFVMNVCSEKPISDDHLGYLECLESLVEALDDIDYFGHPDWQLVLRSICDPDSYPAFICKMLQNDTNTWHRVWMLIIKLLKSHIARNCRYGTPIKPMLPVVETAFKLDSQKVYAFQCWDKLIDGLSSEPGQRSARLIKLLLIPLKVNNAKNIPTVQAKFHTWWNFIRKFQSSLNEFTDDTIISFLNFAFGKKETSKSTALPGAGEICGNLQKQCLQAFVQIVGHDDECCCCNEFPKLDMKILKTTFLASHWEHWMRALETAVLMTYAHSTQQKDFNNEPLPVLCILKAIAGLIGDLPPNGVRKDMFNGLLKVLVDFFQANKIKECTDSLPDILFTLLMSLMEDNEKVKKLLLFSKGEESSLHQIVTIILLPQMQAVYPRYETEKMVKKLKPLSDLIVESLSIEWLLDLLKRPSDHSLKIWTALAHSVTETKTEISPKILGKILWWPLKSTEGVTVDNHSAIVWHTLYSVNAKKLSKTGFDSNILKLCAQDEQDFFRFMVLISLMKNRLTKSEDVSEYINQLQHTTSRIVCNYQKYELAIPILVDTIVLVLNKARNNINENLAQVGISCCKNVLTMLFSGLKSEISEESHISVMLNYIFEAVKHVYTIPEYTHICCEFLEFLTEQASALGKNNYFFQFILSRMYSLKRNSLNFATKLTSKIDDSIEVLTKKQNKDSGADASKTVKEFTSPNVKAAKKTKKKEASIVKTVVENGEEYVVVKSNWKFNPKKLTENQKEKLQRKREDIPALYQDLSQSQDEFKLATWKTDSQDTTTSSNSKTNDETSNILKNMQSSDVVPNIMKNIQSENSKNHSNINLTNTATTKEKDKVNKNETSTPKNSNSPRMAFKDRVFRNVRNLIEKSSSKNNTTDLIISDCQVGDEPKTPPVTDHKNDTNITKSAPSVISADRPSRMKRKPRKFDDTQLFSFKRRRNSQTDSLSNSQSKVETLDNSKKRRKSQDDKSDSTETVNIHNKNKVGLETPIEEVELDAAEEVTKSLQESTQSPLDKVVTEDPQTNIQIDKNVQNNSDLPVEEHTSKQEISMKEKGNEKIQTEAVVHLDQTKKAENRVNGNTTIDELNSRNGLEIVKTPIRNITEPSQKSTTKKSTRKSRIEKELAIDMVEGHPFLKINSEKRLTRKKFIESEDVGKRNSLPEKSNKNKTPSKICPKGTKKSKEQDKLETTDSQSSSITVEESQEKNYPLEEAPCSEDVIESSQDSTFTTISVKSTKRTPRRIPIVSVERTDVAKCESTQDLLLDSHCETLCANKTDNQDDIELPRNKTAEVNKDQSVLTENMDTEPVIDNKMSEDVIILDDEYESPITISNETIGQETQELAEADTQPNNPADFVEFESPRTIAEQPAIPNTALDITEAVSPDKFSSQTGVTQEDVDKSVAEQNESIANCSATDTDVSSPYKDDAQRKQDFLNNTSEISPIKMQSPDKDKSSPEKKDDSSSDYMVVTLSSPVQSNGEPYHSGSPEFFTEDKISPDKRDQSPPRPEVSVSSGSPSSSLSLKKNRPQAMRPSGRAAQMLGLCIPGSLNSIKLSDKSEPEESKKVTSTPARRNLRVLYNAVSDISENAEEDGQDNFLKLKKTLPSVDSSPAVPILKRKLDVVEDNTATPAGKRKRVSFHDPPVSTTVSVQKYIDPACNRSPSSSHKRLERQSPRSLTKSPKRLENVFKLDTVLSKAVESFKEQSDSLTNDTNTSLDVTPAVEVVNTSELNDTDPICPDLVDCKDTIENIALELSSPAMKDLLIKELDGKVVTIGDLAKMTELEVNRLCIKAPKVQVAKKVLADYVNKRVDTAEEIVQEQMISDVIVIDDETAIGTEMDEEMSEPEPKSATTETQTEELSTCDVSMQTAIEIVILASTQTDSVPRETCGVQTLESGFKKTSEVISSCLSERPDFLSELGGALSSEQLMDMLVNKSSMESTMEQLFNKILEQKQNLSIDDSKRLQLLLIDVLRRLIS